ncbi:leucine zipper putative tumor suppressor 1-like isoform X1 [Dunckerocampus dactyliophorus]|uniref:leucine zipper putative tumor suppressor 1-like isoform X1 n=2 Tax=Dunckerocampus dactyliophorus TaxID=161453 RepID=UPI002405E903|nr:leucine zipper putative tumor suppressor 1-like isoform X1 [Dunckerocampus dactyliophorus]XP_054630235.1 leucine zipper putative tumor suppressor 1-like isoform X1 [Dunckerocampus dactyliophorus]XP_054630236.1 leucine zipper putative tumor suppressor 1-like isoform X1 [Dunckerocampus dactyliophorus]XP_054630237.1 leucine zipper putative tumor suppressor 1-like isoform X1 [Dunckerocampus dactyliophorus]
MGSVSSLITSDSLNSKHCMASELKLKNRTNQHRRNGGCSLDALLKCSFTQGSSSPIHHSKGLSSTRSGRSEDFFYIKVSHKPRPVHQKEGSMEDGARNKAGKSDERPKLMLMSGTDGTTAEKSLVRSTAYKPLIPRTISSTEGQHNSLDHILIQLDKPKSPDIRHKRDTPSGTLSDSGHNSMSSLPTHSTSGSLSASTGPVSHSDGCTTPANCLHKGAQPNLSPWVNSSSRDSGYRDGGSPLSSDQSHRLSETVGGIRSPLTTDESLIETLEQRLLERETELQDLQVSYEAKEVAICQLFEDRQKYCSDEMEELNQQCSKTLQQASQMAAKSQQTLQLQVSQLQAENEKLKEDLTKLSRERDLVKQRLRSYEEESAQLAPTLEETQWEVCQKAGEISLLKKQLRDCQEDVSHKLSEIVSLRVQLKEITAKTEMLEKENKDRSDKLHTRSVEVEVCQNELHRKKNEADLLRDKVGKLEKNIEGMKQDLTLAKDQELHQQTSQLEPNGHPQAMERVTPIQNQTDKPEGQVSIEFLQKEVERLRQQLSDQKRAQETLVTSFDQERHTWNKEKDKVIKYQKQLQINYLQMHKKNQDLERVLKELTAELDARAELGLDLHYSSGLQTYDDVIATEI